MFGSLMLMELRSVQALGIQIFAKHIVTFHLSALLRKPRELHTLKLSVLHCKTIVAHLGGLTELKHLHIHLSKLYGCTNDLIDHLKQNKKIGNSRNLRL